jgi:hypothetical protein
LGEILQPKANQRVFYVCTRLFKRNFVFAELRGGLLVLQATKMICPQIASIDNVFGLEERLLTILHSHTEWRGER